MDSATTVPLLLVVVPWVVLVVAALAWFCVNVGLFVGGSNSCVVVGGSAAALWESALSTYAAAACALGHATTRRSRTLAQTATGDVRENIFCCCCTTLKCCTPVAVLFCPAVFFGALTALRLFSAACYAVAWRWNALICASAAVPLFTVAFLQRLRVARAVSRMLARGSDALDARLWEHPAEGVVEQENGCNDVDTTTRRLRCRAKCCATLRMTFAVAAMLVSILLLAGSLQEAVGYVSYPANGTWVTITHNRTPSGCTITQHILTQCAAPTNYNRSLPTFWSEVGGGGHSSSDLWGLRDEITGTFGRRYCSYDMPGTGWSSPMVSGAGRIGGQMSFLYVTDLVMEAMGEEDDTTYVMMGSMDGAYNRAARFAVENPHRVAAVVPVTVFKDEFLLYRDYHNVSVEDMRRYGIGQLQSRLDFGQFVLLAGTAFGLISLFTPENSGYVPQSKVGESTFLNLLNEKQWTTNIDYIRAQINQPVSNWQSEQYIVAHASELGAAGIPVLDFFLARNESQLAQGCEDAGWALDSDDCKFSNWTYAQNVLYNVHLVESVNKVGGRNTSKVVFCGADCAATNNAFLINQDSNIGWFARTMLQALAQIEK